jgi:cystathionine gamma-lyase/cystathionine beta-lyase/cystathionine gamma-lyase/homocysteine desulfhydrase
MKQHEVNGQAVAKYLAGHKKISRVLYPGLAEHPQYELAKRQMSGFGALVTFETGSLAQANAVLRRLRICTVGESLGGVETLVSHPATMTHAALGEEGRAKIGLTDGMVRISAGIEDAEDLLEDLEQALSVL